jgi:hypothetical protein
MFCRAVNLRPLAAAGLLITAGVSVALVPAPAAARQAPDDPFREVEAVRLPLDRSGVWTLNFAYLPPRIVPVDTPAGKRTAWYMLYKVWNTSDTPVTFVPEFELVTKDGELRTFLDEPQPMVFRQIRKIEDPSINDKNPNGELNIQSSVSISKTKIPVTKPDSVPRAVYGLAIWLGVSEKAPTTNNFSVYVGGLSNGLAVQESDGGKETITRKTLQLDFFRPTDNTRPGQNDIRPNDNNGLGAEKWIYRATPTPRAATTPAVPPEEKKNGK